MDFEINSLLKGMQLLLGIQLLAVGVLHLTLKNNKQKRWFAILCLIHGLWFFTQVFNGIWNINFFLFLLLGPGKPIFVGAILFFYYKSLIGELDRKSIFAHLALPTVYYLLLIGVRFFLDSHFSAYVNFGLSVTFSLCSLFIFWYYFFYTRREIITHLKQNLIPKPYDRVKVLFYSLYFFLLQIPLWDLMQKLVDYGVFTNYLSWIQAVYDQFFKYAGYHASYLYLHFLGYFVFLFAISELPFIKRILLPRQTIISSNFSGGNEDVDQKIEKFFIEKKAFKDPDLSLDSCVYQLDISKNDLMSYLRQKQNTGFKDFVNRFRIDEVKMLIKDDAYAHFDLVGIAKECGFSSKSTFHRVFREKEGMTPSEFKSLVSK